MWGLGCGVWGVGCGVWGVGRINKGNLPTPEYWLGVSCPYLAVQGVLCKNKKRSVFFY
ncbi:hypothetical protein [Microcystis aeruginosa]|uniref:hypothetical protein n=1 Tax=Microcystis aeruginosa TaxID=1126 RepID=UPI001E539160|nr:hypothetical protein [Microcystis aeruginosa]